MKSRAGRPLKYARLLEKLDPTKLYSASTIAHFALECGYIKTKDPEERRKQCTRIRLSCCRLVKTYQFPPAGDDLLTLKRQHPQAAWYGNRWLAILEQKKKRKKRPGRKKN